jgi:chemotaxis protein MotB
MPTRRRGHKRGPIHDGEEHGGSERWLVTYADMLTLLLVLFIVLYSMSVVDATKFTQLRAGLAAVFDPGSSVVASQSGAVTATTDDGSSDAQSITPDITPTQVNQVPTPTILENEDATKVLQEQAAAASKEDGDVQKELDQFKAIEDAISAALARQGLTGAAQFSIDQRGLIVTLVTNDVVFSGNSATLLPGGQKLLSVVVPPLRNFTNNIEVDGHTNQQNVSTAPYPSGWELSSARASAVVTYMIGREGISPSRLSAVGFSDQKPLYPPTDPRAVTLNRRVDIVVLSNLAADEKALLPALSAESNK